MQTSKLLLFTILVAFVHSLPNKTIDGNSSDWLEGELFTGGDSSLWGISWNALSQKIYFAIKSPLIVATSTTRWVTVWIDTDPQINTTSGNGTTSGPSFRTQTPRLPFSGNYFFQWRVDGGLILVKSFGSSWTTISTDFLWAQSSSKDFLEVSIGFSYLGNPKAIYVCGCVIDEAVGSERTFASLPLSFTNNYYANITWNNYYGFPLLTSQVLPSLKTFLNATEVFLNSYPAQALANSNWEDTTTWSYLNAPNSNSVVVITNNASVALNSTVSVKHVIVESGATLIQTLNSDLQLTDTDAYFLNYGNYYSSGVVNPSRRLSTKGTNVQFWDLNIRDQSQIGGSNISNALSLLPGSFVQSGSSIFYNLGSTLRYPTHYVRFTEWSSNLPFNVEISGGSTFQVANPVLSYTSPLTVNGDLAISSGSTFSMFNYQASLTVHGNLNSLGAVVLPNHPAGDIYVMGYINNYGSVTCNGNNTIYDRNSQPFNKPTITPSGNVSVNSLDGIVLQAPLGYYSYLWSNGLTTPSITVTSPGSYFVTVIDSGNCIATSNVTIVHFLDNTTITTSGGDRNDNIVDEPPNQSLDSSRKTSDLVPIVGGVLGGFLLMILAILIFVLIRKRRSKDLPLNDIALTEMNSPSSIPATTLKGIRVLEVIGTGQFGKVYRGMMNSTHVALKEITSHESKVSKEAEILSHLNHPNVVRFFGFFKNIYSTFLVFEFVSGGSLDKYLRSKNPSLDLLMIIITQVASGMSYIAEKSIVHGDLAARNVLISTDGNSISAKVSDLGMARFLSGNNYSLKTKIFPVKWSAPEVISHGKISLKSDVWSFGVLVWEIFSYGKVPYPGLSNEEVAKGVAEGKVMEIPQNCPQSIAQIMKDCWELSPDKRPTFSRLVGQLGVVVPIESRRTREQHNFDADYNITTM